MGFKIDNAGHFVVLDSYRFMQYGLNTDYPIFVVDLQQIINWNENQHNIICGDWNLVQDSTRATFYYLHINNPLAKSKVNEMKKELHLCNP